MVFAALAQCTTFNVPDIQFSKNNLPAYALSGFGDASSIRKPSLLELGFRTELGGEYRDRTGDLLVANQALSHLS
jgi:hypothetical protein